MKILSSLLAALSVRGKSRVGSAVALVICLAAFLAWPGSAWAQGSKPVKGIHYVVLDDSDPKVTLVRTLPDVNIHTPSLAEAFGTTMFQIREDNRLSTIALCRRKNGRFDMGVVKTDKDRAKDTIWDSCPDENEQYVYLLPGQTLRLTHNKSLLRGQKVALVDQAWPCADIPCVMDVFGKFGKEFAGTAASAGAKEVAAPPAMPPEARRALDLQAALDACRGEEGCVDQVLSAAGLVKPPVFWRDLASRWGVSAALVLLLAAALCDAVRHRRLSAAASASDGVERGCAPAAGDTAQQLQAKNRLLESREEKIGELVEDCVSLTAQVRAQADVIENKDLCLKTARERNRELEDENRQLRLDKVGLQEQVDVFHRSGPPSSIPSPAAHLQPFVHKSTLPWLGPPPQPSTAPSDPFFAELQQLLAFGTRLVVDTPKKFYLLLDLLQSKVDINLDKLFPDGPPKSLAAHKWDRLVADYRDVILGQARFAFVMDELGLPRPPDYRKPRVLTGG